VLHIDLPSRADIQSLLEARHPSSVSLYLPTTPVSAEVGGSRIELKNLVAAAIGQLEAAGAATEERSALRESLDDLIDDDSFWAYQAHSLAVFATPRSVLTFRLANGLRSLVEVGDRFHVKPLLRTVTFPPAAYVLALAQGSARLFMVSPDLPTDEIRVDGMPSDAASAVGKASIGDRSPSGRMQGSEGQKVRLAQYARAVDTAIRPILTGSDLPLILAATEPLASIFRGVSSAVQLLEETITGNPEELSPGELAERARAVLDGHHAAGLAAVRDRYAALRGRGRATSDLAAVARAATFGSVETVFVDIDTLLPGTIDDDTGVITPGSTGSIIDHGVVDEIARRTWLAGGTVLAVRGEDIPDGGPAAAILRYAS
jgi:hypothetical protein